ncbi:mediator subunit 8 isoform X1 [Carex rostrata]
MESTAVSAAAPGAAAAERLSAGVQQQLNLESVKARAVGLFKAISRILEDFDMYSRTNASPKWQEALGQFSMVSMELFNIVEDIKKVSKAFVVYPRNVNAQNATILPVMLSSKLLPEMETEDNAKRELLLNTITKNPIHNQIEMLKMRIDMIGAACEAAEKVIAECRKMHGLGSRQGIHLAPTLDKAQAAKIQEQENSLRAAINYGEGLRIQGDQRQMLTSLPSHLVEVLGSADGTQNNFGDNSAGVYPKGAPMQQQVPGSQLVGGRSVPSPAGPTFENVSTPPMPPYTNNANNNTLNNNNNTNSPRSGANLMNNSTNMAASPQQLQHQRQQKIMQHVNQHQQMRVGANQQPVLGQGTMPQLHDLQGQTQQKLHQVQGQMQYTQPTLAQQYQNRNMQSALNMQQTMVQNNQLRSMGQFSGTGNNPLYGTAQASPTSQMLTNMSATMQPRMQFGLTQRNLPSQILNDQMFGMGPGNGNAGGTMVGIPQQQGMFSNMNTNPQNMQQGMMGMQQNPNLSQQRTQNQQ